MGTSEPSLGILNKLSELYNVDMHTLYSIDLEGSNNSDNENTNRIPLLGYDCSRITYSSRRKH